MLLLAIAKLALYSILLFVLYIMFQIREDIFRVIRSGNLSAKNIKKEIPWSDITDIFHTIKHNFLKLAELIPIEAIQRLTKSDSAVAMEMLPPCNTHLTKVARSVWLQRHTLETDEKILEAKGFQCDGVYKALASPMNTRISIWKHPKTHLIVTMTEVARKDIEDPTPTYYYDIVLNTTAGLIQLSNNPMYTNLPKPKFFRLTTTSLDSLPKLLAQIKPLIPGGAKLRPVANAKEFYGAQIQKFSEWVWHVDQLKSREFKTALQVKRVELKPEMLIELNEYARFEQSQYLNQNIMDKIKEQSNMTQMHWEKIRQRMVVVHEKMRVGETAEKVFQLFDRPSIEHEEGRLSQLMESREQTNPFTFIEDFCKDANLKVPKRIATLNEPMNVHVYLAAT